MKQEIKNRIEEINSGIVPNGYEKTDFGIFPIDWEYKRLKDLLSFKNGVNADKDKYNSGIKMISVMDILKNRPICYDTIVGQVEIDEATLSKFSVEYGDILFQRSSETFEDAGKSNVYLDIDKVATYSGFVIRGKRIGTYNPYCLNETLKLSYSRKQITQNAAGSQHINIGQESLEPIMVVLPKDTHEQEKIAEILMKWDNAIDLQEQYIQKLEERKNYYLNESFKSIKENYKFIDLYIKAGEGGTPSTTKNEYYENGSIPFVKIEHLYSKYLDSIDSYITKLGMEKSGAWLVPENSLIFSNGATIGEATINRIKVTTKQGILGIIPNEKIDVEYFYYLVKSKYFLNKIKAITTKGTMVTAYLKDIDKIKLYIPDIAQQNNIAKFLSLLDKEISLQKEKLDKLKLQRKAMQQYLLTGVVRVG